MLGSEAMMLQIKSKYLWMETLYLNMIYTIKHFTGTDTTTWNLELLDSENLKKLKYSGSNL